MKRRTDEEISAPLYAYDADIRAQYGCFAGVDEAGRGPLCGPVCVAACILDPEAPVYGINDSKKLTEKKREKLYDIIKETAVAYSVAYGTLEEIETGLFCSRTSKKSAPPRFKKSMRAVYSSRLTRSASSGFWESSTS